MLHKVKALGLAMVAVLAMSAVVASVAPAQFTASSYPTTITATSALGNDVLAIEGTSTECRGHFEGSFSEATAALTIAPAYTECKAFGFATATFNMNECDYVYNNSGAFDIECPAGKAMTLTGGNCEVQFGSQTGLKALAVTNNHPHINVTFNITGITANVTKDGFLCPFNGTGHKSATLTQKSPVTFKPVSGGNTISVE